MMLRVIGIVLVAIASHAASAARPAAAAQGTTRPLGGVPMDSSTEARVRQLSKAYGSLKSLTFSGSIVTEVFRGEQTLSKLGQTFEGSFLAPTCFRIEVTQVSRDANNSRFVAVRAGTSAQWSYVERPPAQTYSRERAASAAPQLDDARQGRPVARAYREAFAHPSLLLAIYRGDVNVLMDFKGKTEVVATKPTRLGGKDHPTLIVHHPRTATTYVLDPETSLLRQVTYVISGPDGKSGTRQMITYEKSTVDMNLDVTAFDWTPPAGFTESRD